MTGGYTGKILFVNLSSGEIREETPDEKLYRDFIGGYGIGARIIYSRQKGGVDPLGPENTLGLITGPLTGTPANTGCRYTAVAKSPLTGGWSDANSGGFFGPYLKFAGYDGVFFTGMSAKPVYLFIDNGRTELKEATHLWGKDTYETEDTLKAELGKTAEIACIGPSGEKLSRISCIVTRRGAAASKNGLGAVMGSKKLKAVAVRGNQPVPITNSSLLNRVKREHVAALRAAEYRGHLTFAQRMKYGTAGYADESAHSGDSPVKNWGGIGVIDFPDVSGLDRDAVTANRVKAAGCWRCAGPCEGALKAGSDEYNYPTGVRRPEYETLAAFGAMCLNTNTESIIMANHICNSYGLDTIAAGSTIAFAIECYENGLITKADTDGSELTWGNHRAIVAMTEKMARREGFGDILADGVKLAAERIGKGAEQYAIHIGGQRMMMHDPKLPALRGTPGAILGFGPRTFQGHIFNTTGLCNFGFSVLADPGKYIAGYMSAVTGWDRSMDELLKIGERIENMRHVFNLREGINPLKLKIHPRITGDPPQKEGPLAGVTVDFKTQVYKNLEALDWGPVTTKPSKRKLLALGLDDVAEEFWP